MLRSFPIDRGSATARLVPDCRHRLQRPPEVRPILTRDSAYAPQQRVDNLCHEELTALWRIVLLKLQVEQRDSKYQSVV